MMIGGDLTKQLLCSLGLAQPISGNPDLDRVCRVSGGYSQSGVRSKSDIHESGLLFVIEIQVRLSLLCNIVGTIE